MYGVLYQVSEEATGKIVLNNFGHAAACFAEYPSYWNGKRIVKVKIPKKSACFSKEQIIDVLDRLRDLFPTTLEETDEDYFIIYKESEYKNQAHIRAAFDFTRALWETGTNLVLSHYFKDLSDNLKNEVDLFVLMQALHVWLCMPEIYFAIGGHHFPSSYTGFIMSKDQFLDEVGKKRQSNGSTYIWNKAKGSKQSWNGWSIPNRVRDRKEEFLKIAKISSEEDVKKIIELTNK